MQPGEVRMEIVEFFNTNDPRAQRLSQRGRDPTLCLDASEWKDESFRTSRIEICSKWAHVKENQWDFCPQAEWGGSPEIKLLSIILQRDIVIFNDGGPTSQPPMAALNPTALGAAYSTQMRPANRPLFLFCLL